jgi:hypothetical protein
MKRLRVAALQYYVRPVDSTDQFRDQVTALVETAVDYENVERDPRCSLLVESERSYDKLKGLLIRGQAEIVRDAAVVFDTLLAVNRKYQQGPEELVRPLFEKQSKKRVLMKIVPERASSWDHAKLGGAY